MEGVPGLARHPILACADEVGAALDRAAPASAVFLSTREKAQVLLELTGLEARLAELKLRVLASADDVALESGDRSAATWLAHRTRSGIGAALGHARLAEALDARCPGVREALMAGRVGLEQARVIVTALDELPADLDPELRAKAEAHLITEAGHFGPRELRRLGRKVLEVVAPDVADDQERRLLEAEEARARRLTSLRFRRRGDGTTDIHARVSDAVAARLRSYLESFSAPRRAHLADGPPERVDPESGRPVPHSTVLGRAFCALLEAMPAEVMPRHGGSATTVVVTIDHETLRSELGVAGLDTGDRITASDAVRLACNASILPMVLNGRGQPLHLGRSRRLFSPAQRLAMAHRDRHCRAHGCEVPAAWCEAHHLRPWVRGGRTDIEDGVLLCSWHHHRAHDRAYHSERMPNGDLRFRRRT